jgi:hypothetical protein
MQDHARKNAETEKKKAEKEIKITQMKAAQQEEKQKKAAKAAIAADKYAEIVKNHINREEKRPRTKQSIKSSRKS